MRIDMYVGGDALNLQQDASFFLYQNSYMQLRLRKSLIYLKHGSGSSFKITIE